MSDLNEMQVTLGRRQYVATEPGYSRLKRILGHAKSAQRAAELEDEDGALDSTLLAVLVALEIRHPDLKLEHFTELPIKPPEIKAAFVAVCRLAGLEEVGSDPNAQAATGGTGTSTTPT